MLKAIEIPVSQQLKNFDQMIMVLATVWIRFCFKADPDPVFYYLNADPDPRSQKRMRMDLGQTSKPQKVVFLHGKYRYLQ
jgi:hypothetical protein